LDAETLCLGCLDSRPQDDNLMALRVGHDLILPAKIENYANYQPTCPQET